MEELVVWAILNGIIGAGIGLVGMKKGYSWWAYFLCSILFSFMLVALVSMFLPDRSKLRQCPHCQSWVPKKASVCAKCTRELGAAPGSPRRASGMAARAFPCPFCAVIIDDPEAKPNALLACPACEKQVRVPTR